MRKSVLAAVLVLASSPAFAVSYSVAVGPVSGSGSAGPVFSFAGFDGSLGTLQQVAFSLSGSTTYNITLNEPVFGEVSYDLMNGVFLYIDGFSAQPYIREGASGTATVAGTSFEVVSTGADYPTVYDYPAALGFFTRPTVSGRFTVDLPFMFSIRQGDTSIGATPSIVGASAGGTVTYTYLTDASAVPEPASWALMTIGFGAAGAALRRRPGRLRLA